MRPWIKRYISMKKIAKLKTCDPVAWYKRGKWSVFYIPGVDVFRAGGRGPIALQGSKLHFENKIPCTHITPERLRYTFELKALKAMSTLNGGTRAAASRRCWRHWAGFRRMDTFAFCMKLDTLARHCSDRCRNGMHWRVPTKHSM